MLRAGQPGTAHGPVTVLCAALICAFLTGCAVSTVHWSPVSEGARMVEGVPDYVQDEYQCGPSALAAVIGYWRGRGLADVEADAHSIALAVFSPGAGGVLGMDLYFHALDLGLKATQSKGSAIELRRLVDAGRPAIILVDLGIGAYQVNHFLVVSGYTGEGLVVHTGGGVKLISDKELERSWKKTGYWMLIITP